MSAGTPITTLRIPTELKAIIEEKIESANRNRKLEPYNLTTWILVAINEKLKHLERSRSRNHDTVSRNAETPKAAETEQITDGILPNLSL